MISKDDTLWDARSFLREQITQSEENNKCNWRNADTKYKRYRCLTLLKMFPKVGEPIRDVIKRTIDLPEDWCEYQGGNFCLNLFRSLLDGGSPEEIITCAGIVAMLLELEIEISVFDEDNDEQI